MESLVQTKTRVKQDLFPMMEEVENVRTKIDNTMLCINKYFLILYFSLPFSD